MRNACDSKAFYKFQTFEESQYFSSNLWEKTAYYKISKERRIAIGSAQ